MARKKKIKKSKVKVLLVSLVSLVLIVLISMNLFSVWYQMIEINKEKKAYESELASLTEEEEYLETEIDKLQDPEYAAKYAREQYLYSKDGEFNIRIN